jgi:putative peptidoglycan lipid II flippase
MGTSAGLEETKPTAPGAPSGKGTAIRTGRAISVVFIAGVAARLLSIVSQALIAASFGTRGPINDYVLALILPTTIAGILTTAVGAALIPVFIDYRENKDEAECMRLLWSATTLGTLLVLAATGVMIACSPFLVPLFGFQGNPAAQSLTVLLARFLMPVMLLQGLITLLSAVLNAYGRFAVPTLAPVAITFSTIGFLLLARPWGIYALVWATLVGYLLTLLILVIDYLRLGLHFRVALDWRHPGVRRIAALSSPALLGALLVNGNILVDQFMAARLSPDGPSSLSYAVKLVDTPSQFFYLALSTALLPVFSMQVARREFTLLSDTFRQVVVFLGIILLPAGALLGVLARPVVQVFYQRGNFDAHATDVVAGAVMLLGPSMFLVTYGFVNGRMYNALQDNWTLRNASLLSLVLNGILDYIFMQFWGVAGIAFSTTLTYLLVAISVILVLNRKLQGIRLSQIAVSLGKAALAAATMWSGCAFLERIPLFARMPALLELVVLGSVGLLVYLVLIWGMRLHELHELWAVFRNRIGRRPPETLQANTGQTD